MIHPERKVVLVDKYYPHWPLLPLILSIDGAVYPLAESFLRPTVPDLVILEEIAPYSRRWKIVEEDNENKTKDCN